MVKLFSNYGAVLSTFFLLKIMCYSAEESDLVDEKLTENVANEKMSGGDGVNEEPINFVKELNEIDAMLQKRKSDSMKIRHAGKTKYDSKANAEKFLLEFDVIYTQNVRRDSDANWNYVTNMKPDENEESSTSSTEDTSLTGNSTWMKNQVQEAKLYLKHLGEKDFTDKTLYRMLKLITVGVSFCNNEKINRKIDDLDSELSEIYDTAKVGNKPIEELENDLKSSKLDYYQKLQIWKDWRDVVGPKMRSKYIQYVDYSNKCAKDSGYHDIGEVWREMDFGYETDDLVKMAHDLYVDILPLYQQLHAYVRRKLALKYPNDFTDLRGPIPAHILGDMWAQEWDVFPDVVPFPDAPIVDITPELIRQRYTPIKMFKTAEAFFVTLGLDKMTDTFWKKSMFVRPKNKVVECHASSEDFFREDDFRIKMCTYVNSEDFATIHHEMGHIEYFMEYAKQPAIFRDGANAAFHEAIGDTIALSVHTPEHAMAINLLPKHSIHLSPKRISKTDINFLMRVALERIAFIPFGYIVDKYRWDVFSGKIGDNLNTAWWFLRETLQGIKSPIARSETDFDPGSKYHIAANVPYIRYFFASVAQYQFYEAMCKAKGHTGPLHKCDFCSSDAAGNLLKKMLQLGRSRPWQDAMEVVTGERKFNTRALKTYFQPLMAWLVEENKKHGDYIGWDVTDFEIGKD